MTGNSWPDCWIGIYLQRLFTRTEEQRSALCFEIAGSPTNQNCGLELGCRQALSACSKAGAEWVIAPLREYAGMFPKIDWAGECTGVAISRMSKQTRNLTPILRTEDTEEVSTFGGSK
jgi:hypothetical protein